MTRNALTSLDPETRDAVEAAARGSGMSLDEWVAAAVIEQGRRAARQPQRPRDELETAIAKIAKATRPRGALDPALHAGAGERDGVDHAGRVALALDSVASWIERAEHRLSATAQVTAEQQQQLASALAEALTAIKVRLDRVESQAGAGRPEMAEALTAIRGDVAALSSRFEDSADPWHAALQGIAREVERLRASFDGLVTRDEVATLEDLVRGLAADLAQPGSPADVKALAESVAQVQSQVRDLAEEVSQDLHRRIKADVENLARKLDQVAAAGASRAGVEAVAHQIADMRHSLSRMAEPHRIERLSEEVAGLGRQVAEMRAQQIAPADFASLKGALEDIRSALQRSEAASGTSEVPGQLQSLNRRLDALMKRPEPADLDPIAAQLSRLTEQIGSLASSMASERPDPSPALASGMDRLTGRVEALAEKIATAPEPLLGRLDEVQAALREAGTPGAVLDRIDQLEDTVRQIGAQADTASVELMLRGLIEKLDQGHSSSQLDGLERRLEDLAQQLTRSASEQVQEALADTLAHVKTLRGEAAILAERAAKAAVREAHAAAPADIESVKRGFAELRELQAEAEKRTQATLKAVHNALETLMMRQPPTPAAVETRPTGGPAGIEATPAGRLEAAVRKLHAATMAQVEPDRSPAPVPSSELAGDEVLLEPGTPRGTPAASFIAPQEGDPSHARANFIAAARRAAQIASADAGGKAAEPAAKEEPEAAVSSQTLVERIRQTFDNHRRPLLLSMALLILVAGSMQTVTRMRGAEPATVARTEAAAAPAASPAAPSNPLPTQPESAPATNAAPESAGGEAVKAAAIVEPTEVASIVPASAPSVSRSELPAHLPAGAPASLLDAAERGDSAAIFELASRLAEGRTVPREPALAAKLFEKAAGAGLAPAQFRLGSMYEKGVGVARDLALARTWYERAARSGNTRAMHNLAVILAEGIEGKPDYENAGRWFLRAAEFGVRDSQYNLAVLFARGLGVPNDLAQSYKWFALAAAQGDSDAGKKRDEVAARLSPEILAAAKTLVAQWKPQAAPAAANEVPMQPTAWSAAKLASKRG